MPVSTSTRFFSSAESHSAANETRSGGKKLPAVRAHEQPGKPVQMAVSTSATFVPAGVALAQINLLDGLVPAAEAAAHTDITAPGIGYVHTPTQAAYMNNPTPAGWGCCVEEKLNITAPGLGWATQWAMPGARPDYRKIVGADEVFVDLTSVLQAGVGGNHITGKLNTAAQGLAQPTWKGADITHASMHPLGLIGPVAPNYNGIVTHNHMLYFQQYRNYLDNPNHANWTPEIQNLWEYYGPVSMPTYTQVWGTGARNLFVVRAQQPADDEGGSSEEWSSDDDESMGEDWTSDDD